MALDKKNEPLVEIELNLLTAQERSICQQIATRDGPHSQRATALLALDEGLTQPAAGERSGLSKHQVKYWLGKFRQQRLSIFPDEFLSEARSIPPVARSEEPDQVVEAELDESEEEAAVDMPAETNLVETIEVAEVIAEKVKKAKKTKKKKKAQQVEPKVKAKKAKKAKKKKKKKEIQALETQMSAKKAKKVKKAKKSKDGKEKKRKKKE